LQGAATAGHQIEGNNVNSDYWVLENVKPTLFAEPSGDANNSLSYGPATSIWRAIGLNAYRFSIEWCRIEPEPACFPRHAGPLQGGIAGCHARGWLQW
jgi:beta-glucosidase